MYPFFMFFSSIFVFICFDGGNYLKVPKLTGLLLVITYAQYSHNPCILA